MLQNPIGMLVGMIAADIAFPVVLIGSMVVALFTMVMFIKHMIQAGSARSEAEIAGEVKFKCQHGGVLVQLGHTKLMVRERYEPGSDEEKTILDAIQKTGNRLSVDQITASAKSMNVVCASTRGQAALDRIGQAFSPGGQIIQPTAPKTIN